MTKLNRGRCTTQKRHVVPALARATFLSMKRKVRAAVFLTSIGAMLLPLGGCKNAAQRALEHLERNNVLYSVESFVASAGHGDLATVQTFLDAGMDPDAQDVNGYTALMLAAEQGHTETVNLLIERGASPDVQGVEGSTALMQAAFHNRSGAVQALLSAGAEGGLSDEKGWTAFMKAVFRGHNRIVEAMLPHNAEQLERAIMVAAIMDHRAVAETLLAAGAPVDFKDRGQTPLMMAAGRGNEDMIRLLLNSGAEALEADSDGRTASMIAMIKGHKAVARMLQDAESGKLPAPPPPLPAEEPPATASSSPPPQPTPAPESDTTPTPAPDVADAGSPTPEPPDTSDARDGPTLAAAEPTPRPASGLDANEERQSPDASGDEVLMAAPDISDDTSLPEATSPADDTVPLSRRPLDTVAQADVSPGDDPATLQSVAPETDLPDELPDAGDLVASLPDAPADSSYAGLPPMTLVEFNETRLPILLTAVEGGIGEFRMQDGSGELLYARQGDQIPGTDFRVSSLSKRQIVDKRGDMVDAAEAIVRNESSGAEVRLVKGLPARATQSFALLAVSGQDDPIKVRENEEFSLPNDPTTRYRVLDLRDSQAVVQVVDTGETLTIAR